MKLAILPERSGGGGGGGGGIEELTADEPLTVTALGTDRLVGVNLSPDTDAGPLTQGLFLGQVSRRMNWITFSTNASITWSGHPSPSGTAATNPGLAKTNFYDSGVRARLTAAAGVNVAVGNIFQASAFCRGAATHTGGFLATCIFGFNALNADSRIYVGLTRIDSGINLAVEPSTFFTQVALATDSGDTNLQIMTNDETGLSTKVNTGIARPTVNTNVYALQFYCPPADSYIRYVIRRLDDTTIAPVFGDVSTNLPPAISASGSVVEFIGWVVGVGNGPTTATATAVDIYRLGVTANQ